MRLLLDDDDLRAGQPHRAEPVTNAEPPRPSASVLHRPTLPVPGFALKAVLGEFAEELLIDQRMVPSRLLATGFQFRDPTVAAVIADLLASRS